MRLGTCVTVLFVLGAGQAAAQAPEEAFPRPASLEPAVSFWTRVYTEVGTNGGFLHDPVDLSVVYEVIELDDDVNRGERRREIDRRSKHYGDILNRLADGPRNGLSTEEARVLALWPKDVSNGALRQAAGRIRFQLGQAERFQTGLARSGRWKLFILEVLAERGLPSELAVLPHVESSFDPTAYSKVGAAGMWQFTRSTGLRYMQIDHIVDERRDPFLSTYAAAQLLADNYAVIESWPLALTAYNHGLAGMRRAVSQTGTKDIGVIVERYKSRMFGFASRNFYAAFLAALDVDRNPERYFGPVSIETPDRGTAVRLPDYMAVSTVANALDISTSDLARLNPALLDTVWRGDKFVPKGFPLRVPASAAADASARLEAVPSTARFAAQQPDEYHRVRRGDTLSVIAGRYGISVAALVSANGLRSSHLIREGQTLTLPIPGGRAPLPASLGDAVANDGRYVVRRGDSIARIARRLGVDENALLAANAIIDKNRIYEGQSLEIPGVGAQPIEVVAANETSAPEAETEPAITVISTAKADEVVAEPESEISVAVLETDPPAAIDENAEPTLDSNALASLQARLAADPNDYSLAEDDSIQVQPLETLGHYADWLGIPTQRLRDVNGLAFREAVVLGQRVKLDFSEATRTEFEQRRLAYQERIQESFFSAYQIDAIREHVVEPGESLWLLAQRTYEVPVWLLRQYNPDVDLDRVQPGTVVKFPRLRRIETDAG